jgi:hypothetical protein
VGYTRTDHVYLPDRGPRGVVVDGDAAGEIRAHSRTAPRTRYTVVMESGNVAMFNFMAAAALPHSALRLEHLA